MSTVKNFKCSIPILMCSAGGAVGNNVSCLQVAAQDPPHRVIEAALTIRQRHLDLSDEDINKDAKLSVLKLRDKEEYMLQEICIHTYEVKIIKSSR